MAGSGTQKCVVTIIIYHCDVAEALSSAGISPLCKCSRDICFK